MSQEKTDFIKKRPNYLYVILSVSVMLFFLGFFAASLLKAQGLVDYFKEQVNIMIELEDVASEEGLADLKAQLNAAPYTKNESITYVTKEEGAKLLEEEFGTDFLSLDMPNPLYDVLTFNVKAAYLNQDSLSKIRIDLKRYPFVSDVFYQESLISEMAQNIESIAYIALIVSVFFIFIAVLLIHNTIRLALYADRFLIKNMQLVGASWTFISRPYIIRSIWHGVISAAMAIVALILLYFFLRKQLYQLEQVISLGQTSLLFLGLLFLGTTITGASTYYVVNRYLKMREDDLY
ncbi:MAG: permease-like cell division protein FtsX [Bacteroidota bacterium]